MPLIRRLEVVKSCKIIGFAVSGDSIAVNKKENIEKYQDLTRLLQKILYVKVQVIQLAVGSFSGVPKQFGKKLKDIVITTEMRWLPKKKTYFKKFIALFYGWDSTAPRLQPLRGGSLLLTIQFPEIPGTHFINLGRMKG